MIASKLVNILFQNVSHILKASSVVIKMSPIRISCERCMIFLKCRNCLQIADVPHW